MKKNSLIILLFFSFLFVNCKNETSTKTEVKSLKTEKQISEVVNEDFDSFLKKFSNDSVFQISRVTFPLKIKERNDENMMNLEEKFIKKSEYTKLDFNYPKDALTREFDRYTQKKF